jgi:hypothetical protein
LRRKRSLISAVVAVATSVSLSGCSFIFSQGPPPNHERLPYFDCSTSYVPPVLDTVWAGLNGLGAVIAAGQSEAEWRSKNNYSQSTVIASGLIWLGVSGASAIYGYSKAGSCNEARAQLMLRQSRPAPTPSWPPPPGYPPPGYPPGYPPPGSPPPGYPPPPPGYPQGGYPPPGYPQGGYPPPGYPQGGYPPPAQPAPQPQNPPPAQPAPSPAPPQ